MLSNADISDANARSTEVCKLRKTIAVPGY